MKILTFTGWGQADTSFLPLFPDSSHVKYLATSSIEALQNTQYEADIVIGWSLGGQVALRLISEGKLRTALLVLLATPFQFLQGQKIAEATPLSVWDKFIHDFEENQNMTLRRFQGMIAAGDSYGKEIRGKLELTEKKEYLGNWLRELDQFSCEHIIWESIPPTLLIHGEKDTVVPVEQAYIFSRYLPESVVDIMGDCGHAPHLHDSNHVVTLITDYYNKLIS